MTEKAEVKYDPKLIDASLIADLINDLGYDSQLIDHKKVGQTFVEIAVSSPSFINCCIIIQVLLFWLSHYLKIEGMKTESCAAEIERSLISSKGILSANVSFANKKAQIYYDSDSTGARNIIEDINVWFCNSTLIYIKWYF